MGDKKKFLHFLSVNGSGNHLIVDIMKNFNISRISDDLDRLVALLILKKKKFIMQSLMIQITKILTNI